MASERPGAGVRLLHDSLGRYALWRKGTTSELGGDEWTHVY
jgi:hypothetical protein